MVFTSFPLACQMHKYKKEYQTEYSNMLMMLMGIILVKESYQTDILSPKYAILDFYQVAHGNFFYTRPNLASILLAYNEAEFLDGPLKIIPGKHIFIHLTYRASQSWHQFEHKSAILNFGFLAKASRLLGNMVYFCVVKPKSVQSGRAISTVEAYILRVRSSVRTQPVSSAK